MAFFPDLSPYTYFSVDHFSVDRGQRMLNVGWLGGSEAFATGPFPADLLACVLVLCRSSVNCTHGFHECELCPPTGDGSLLVGLGGARVALGNGEIHVQDDNGIAYAAPTLIYHYIRDHDYGPPHEFTEALRALCTRRSAAPLTKRQSYEAAVSAFQEELGILRTAFPQLPTAAEQRIFLDLRAKTKFGRLKQLEDVEAILLHRAPLLSVDEARGAAAEIWAAWHQFLSHEKFEADWLRLDGPTRPKAALF